MNKNNNQKIIALSGGVGGAKLALGLSHLLTPEQLTIVANTGDDFEHLSLKICPDLDTLMYTLAGVNNQNQGWGLANESWQALDALEKLNAPTWFKLGDRDIATHLLRTDQLRKGKTLSQVTAMMCKSLKVKHPILPMTDDRVSTTVQTPDGILEFQHYFVREHCEPTVQDFYFDGIDTARAQVEFLELLESPDLSATIICPSNPFVSVAPILQLHGVYEALMASTAPVVAVSPIIAGAAVKGPAAKMMVELNMPPSSLAIAKYYGSRLDGLVIDQADADQADEIRELGINVLVTSIMMNNLDDKVKLSAEVLEFADSLNKNTLRTDPNRFPPYLPPHLSIEETS